jgi:uncharacterized circularly permuted ATP-grasp superfamily protein
MTGTRLKLYDTEGVWDEALDPDGAPRPEYEDVLERVLSDPAGARAAVSRSARELGATFGEGEDSAFAVDPVPRIVTAEEWDWLEAALAQRARALNAFVIDVYDERRAVREGVVPERVVETSRHLEPDLTGVDLGHAPATVAGFDLVRDADGELRVLEDNLRTPSGIAYALAARRACDAWLGDAVDPARRAFDGYFAELGAALAEMAKPGDAAPFVLVLSDGPGNSAWFEHELVADAAGLPVATPDDLRVTEGRLVLTREGDRPVDVIWRRTDEDRLRDDEGRPTWLGELLVEPLRAGTLRLANACGCGVADDKLVHAYVEDLIRFHLGEEPLIHSVPTLDLTAEGTLDRVHDEIADLVLKPRGGYGGEGVVIGSRASVDERREAIDRAAAAPEDFIAQPVVSLSRHPTVVGDGLEPRRVDLRAFAVSRPGRTAVAPGGLTRVALEHGSMIVNSSAGGGGKDTWILG